MTDSESEKERKDSYRSEDECDDDYGGIFGTGNLGADEMEYTDKPTSGEKRYHEAVEKAKAEKKKAPVLYSFDEFHDDEIPEDLEIRRARREADSASKQKAKSEAQKAMDAVKGKTDADKAPADFGQLLRAMAMLNSSSYGGITSVMNRNAKNERGFFTTEVVMRLQGSLEQLAAPKDDPNRVQPVLRLEPSFAGFEVPGKAGNKRMTQLHAQGRIYLLGARSDFPCSLALQVGSKLRGAAESNVHSGAGVRASHIIVAEDKYSYAHSPLLLTHSDVGELTEKYAKEYPDYLSSASMQSMWKRVPGKANLIEVKIKSPLFDAINVARERGAEENAAKSKSDSADASEFKKLRAEGDHENATGFTYAPAIEVAHALKSMEKPLKSKVNYVPLYEAFEFPLKRAFARRSESGAKNASSEWLDPAEVSAKKKRSNWTEEHKDEAFKQVHTLTARFLVEYVPLTSMN